MTGDGQIDRRTMLAAPLALALAGSTARADPIQITLRVGSRPAQPAAIAAWSGALATLAQNAITGTNRQLATGQTTASWIGANFTKHHVIPQSLLQVAAGLAVAPELKQMGAKQRLKAALVAIAAGDAVAPDGTLNLGPIAWSQVNLFEGPNGFYRGDDPGDGPEQKRPASLDQGRWKALQGVSEAINGLGTFRDRRSNDGKDYVIPTKNLLPQQKGGKTGLDKIVDAFETLARIGGGQNHAAVQRFAPTDWVDFGGDPIDVAQLIVYNNSIIQAQLSPSRKSAYSLRG